MGYQTQALIVRDYLDVALQCQSRSFLSSVFLCCLVQIQFCYVGSMFVTQGLSMYLDPTLAVAQISNRQTGINLFDCHPVPKLSSFSRKLHQVHMRQCQLMGQLPGRMSIKIPLPTFYNLLIFSCTHKYVFATPFQPCIQIV